MSSEKYSVARAKPPEKGFPVDTFSRLRVDVQDTGEMPERIYEYPDDEVFDYPSHGLWYDYFDIAAHEAQEALRARLEFRELPDLSLSGLVTVGESDAPPRWQPVPNFTQVELSPGIASGLSRQRAAKLSPSEMTALALRVIADSLALYLDGHPTEQRQISELRQRL